MSAVAGSAQYLPNATRDTLSVSTDVFLRQLRKRRYELEDHLGNEEVVITDLKLGAGGAPWSPDVVAYNNYYSFGMLQPRRSWQSDGYRYGYNGKEGDVEEKGPGNSVDYGFRMYDPRVARFMSVDPLTSDYPWYSPYQYAGNIPIRFVDRDGMEPAEPPGFGDWIFNMLTGEPYITRAYYFAAEHQIDVGNIFYYPQGLASKHGGMIIIFDPSYTPALSRLKLYKHVFRNYKDDGGWRLMTSEDNDDLYLPWDLKLDADGVPIPNESDWSAVVMPAPGLSGGGGAGATSKLTMLGRQLKVGQTLKWWPRLSKMAVDWIKKGIYVHVGAIELKLEVSAEKGLHFLEAFSSNRGVKGLQDAIKTANKAMKDVGFRRLLWNEAQRAIQYLSTSNDAGAAERLKSIQEVARSLEKLGLDK